VYAEGKLARLHTDTQHRGDLGVQGRPRRAYLSSVGRQRRRWRRVKAHSWEARCRGHPRVHNARTHTEHSLEHSQSVSQSVSQSGRQSVCREYLFTGGDTMMSRRCIGQARSIRGPFRCLRARCPARQPIFSPAVSAPMPPAAVCATAAVGWVTQMRRGRAGVWPEAASSAQRCSACPWGSPALFRAAASSAPPPPPPPPYRSVDEPRDDTNTTNQDNQDNQRCEITHRSWE
jgi:hypothetical protein